MEKKLRVAMFGQKRLSREGGIEIVVKELCTRMARDGCQRMMKESYSQDLCREACWMSYTVMPIFIRCLRIWRECH